MSHPAHILSQCNFTRAHCTSQPDQRASFNAGVEFNPTAHHGGDLRRLGGRSRRRRRADRVEADASTLASRREARQRPDGSHGQGSRVGQPTEPPHQPDHGGPHATVQHSEQARLRHRDDPGTSPDPRQPQTTRRLGRDPRRGRAAPRRAPKPPKQTPTSCRTRSHSTS